MANPLKPRQLSLLRRSLRLDVVMDHAAGPFPLVSFHRQLLLLYEKISPIQKRKRQGVEVPHPVQPQMPEVHDLLQLLRIERPPLGAASTPSIRQCRNTASPKSCKPWAAFHSLILRSATS